MTESDTHTDTHISYNEKSVLNKKLSKSFFWSKSLFHYVTYHPQDLIMLHLTPGYVTTNPDMG